jgi:branched-chain amino acid transport system permease protein
MSWSLTHRAREISPPAATSLLRGAAPLAACVFLAAAAQLLLKPWLISHGYDFTAKMLVDIGINIVLAVSLTLVNGFTGQFSIGHAAFMAVGGYTAAAIVYYGSFRLAGNPDLAGGQLSSMMVGRDVPLATGHDALFLVAIVAGGLVAAICGFLVGLPSLRLKGDYLAIVTLGFGEIVRVFIQSRTTDVLYDADEIAQTPAWQLATRLGGSLGFSGLPFYTSLFWVYLLVFITLLVAWRIKNSTYGRALISIREDEIAGEAMGVDTTSFKIRAFVLSSFFAGCAGALFAHNVGVQLNAAELGFVKSFDIIIMVVLGGLGSISGAVIAAIILTILPEALRSVAEYRMVVYAVALILMMIVRPKGLLGVHEVWQRGAWDWLRKLMGRGNVSSGGTKGASR